MPSHPQGRSKSTLCSLLCVQQSLIQCSITDYRGVLAQRAFQDVPRSLRRRSASHNVKRVPRRLREKAAREMLADGTKAPTKVRGRQRLAMEIKRLAGKISKKEQKPFEEMTLGEELDDQEIPKLKPRKVTAGKFAHRQGSTIYAMTNTRGQNMATDSLVSRQTGSH